MGKFRETFKIQEVWIALVVGLVLAIILNVILCSNNGDFSVIWKNYGTFISSSGAFIGFLITAFTILFTFPEEGKIKSLKKHTLYPHIFYLFIITIISQVILFSLSILGLLFTLEQALFAMIVITAIIESTVLLILILWILKRMLDLYFNTSGSKKS